MRRYGESSEPRDASTSRERWVAVVSTFGERDLLWCPMIVVSTGEAGTWGKLVVVSVEREGSKRAAGILSGSRCVRAIDQSAGGTLPWDSIMRATAACAEQLVRVALSGEAELVRWLCLGRVWGVGPSVVVAA